MSQSQYTVYGQRQRTSRRWPYFVVLAAIIVGALAAWQFLAAPRVGAVTPGPDGFTNQSAPRVALDVKGLGSFRNVKVSFDGRDVSALVKSENGQLVFAAPNLADGEHHVIFDASRTSVVGRAVHKEWHFTVDTKLPTLKLSKSLRQGFVNTAPPSFAGVTEPFSTVGVKAGDTSGKGEADAAGKFKVTAALPEGSSAVTITATDRAGNVTSESLKVFVDAVPPELSVTKLPKKLKKTRVTARIRATDQLGRPKVVVQLDGKPAKTSSSGSALVLKSSALAQGTHTLLVTATDKGGNVITNKQPFLVDSTEQFGAEPMGPGARGKDVTTLQQRLKSAGVYRGAFTRVYDQRTTTAVKAYQSKFNLAADGRVGDRTLTALSGRIIIDLGSLSLTLYRGDKAVRTYRIASGQPAYPTPTGTFSVVNMQMNPTWTPPPGSDWAKGSKPIPPGPNNPLGTRWIGLNAPGVGIHGTLDPGSIGSYASHGCIRMITSQVEDLYGRVGIGMPVIIRR